MQLPEEISISQHITLKRIDHAVAKEIAGMLNDISFQKDMGETVPHPYTLQDAKEYIAYCLEGYTSDTGEKNYGIYIEDSFAGMIGREQKKGGRKKHNYHIGYRLGKQFHSQGYMTTIAQGFTQRIFENIKSCRRIYALVFGWNNASAKVLKKSGFTLEATLREAIYREGERHDEWIYGKLRGE